MTEKSNNISQPVSDSDQFFNLLPTVIPDEFHELIRDKRAEFIVEFLTLSPFERRGYLYLLRGRQEMLRESSEFPKAMSCPKSPPLATATGINFEAASSDSYVQQGDDASDLPPKHDGAAGTKFQNHQAGASNGTPSDHSTASYHSTRTKFGSASSCSNHLLSDNFLQRKWNLTIGTDGTRFQHILLKASDGTSPDHDGAAYPNNGAAGTKFQNHQAGASNGTPSDHDTASYHSNTAGARTNFVVASSSSNAQLSDDFLQCCRNLAIGTSGTQSQHQLLKASDGTPPGHYGAAYRNNGATGTKFQNHQAGASHGTPSDHDTLSHNSNAAGTPCPSDSNNDVVLSMDGLLSGLQPSLCDTLNKPVTNMLKEIHDFFQGNPNPLKEILGFFQGNPELARDDPTWFKTLPGINGGVIITLISNSISNNPQSLPTKIMESFAATCAVVGFSVSLAGLYLSTNKPRNLQFGCDSEVSTRKMGIVGGFVTALGFTTGVLLLLPNNLFRWITTCLACAAVLIPVLFKLLC